MKKRVLAILLGLTMGAIVAGCGGDQEPEYIPSTEDYEQEECDIDETEEVDTIEEEDVIEDIDETEDVAEAEDEDTIEVTIEERLLFEHNDIKLTAVSIDESDFSGNHRAKNLNVFIENDSDIPIIIQVRDVSINGRMMNRTAFNSETMAGMRNNQPIVFNPQELEDNGIDVIGTIEITFVLHNSETWEPFFTTDLITIETSAVDQVSHAEQPTQEMREVMNRDGITVYFIDFRDSDFFGGVEEARFFIRNDSDIPIMIFTQNTSVNGFMMNGMLHSVIRPDRATITSVMFMGEEFERNGIDEIETMNLYFLIINLETDMPIFESETITLP